LFRRELMKALAEYRMTPEQWQIMASLWSMGEDLSQKEISYLTLKDKHTVSRIINRLERNGWVVRRTDEKDARSFKICLTARAGKLKDSIPKKLISHFKPIHGILNDKERDTLFALLKKMRRELEER